METWQLDARAVRAYNAMVAAGRLSTAREVWRRWFTWRVARDERERKPLRWDYSERGK